MKCNECEEFKIIFVLDPRDEKQELYICRDCSTAIQYEYDEVMTGRSIEREAALCL